MMSVGSLAKYYGLLPSEVLERATTYDLMVYDIMMTWEKDRQDKASGRTPELSQEELMKILKESRGEA